MKPRFKKEMEGGDKTPKKKVMYLRLGYTEIPRTRKKVTKKIETKPECPGGTAKCNECTASSAVITKEALTGELPGTEAIAPLFKSAIPERRCCSESGNGCCCAEE